MPAGKLHKVKIDREAILQPLHELERWVTEIEKQWPGAPIVDQLDKQINAMRDALSLLNSFGPNAHLYLADAEWLAAKKGISPNHARDLLAGKALMRDGNLQLFSPRSLD